MSDFPNLSHDFGRNGAKPRLIATCLACSLAGIILTPEPARASCAVPNAITNGQVADASQVMGNMNALASCVDAHDPAGPTNSVQINAGGSAFGGVGPLSDGQLIVGATGGAPQSANITAGPGIAIANGPGSITISTVGASGATYSAPSTSTFAWVNHPAGAAMASVTGALQITQPSLGSGRNLALLQTSIPSTPYTRWMRLSFAPPNAANYFQGGIALSDTSGKVIAFGIVTNGGNSLEVDYYTNPTTLQSYALTISAMPSIPLIGVNDDGTNLNFMVSYDGVSSFTVFSVSRTAFLASGPSQIGPFVNAYSQPVAMNIAHWGPSLPGPL